MAGEIQTESSTGKTLYFLVRNSAGQVWNGSAFEAYNASHWSTYVFTLTEQGSTGYYVGNMVAASAGLYSIDIRQQVGGSAANTDPGIGAGPIAWNGSAEVSAENAIVATNGDKTGYTLGSFGFTVTTDISSTVATNLNATVSSRATPAQILATPANLLATNSAGKVQIDDTQLPSATLTANSIGELLVRAAAQRANFTISGNVATATIGSHTITLTVDSASSPSTGTVTVS